jgi:pyrroloquinoline quinone (PQQ) biosynthesis protein C
MQTQVSERSAQTKTPAVDGKAIVDRMRKAAAESIDKDHPLWSGIEQGKYTKEQLKEWIKQEYHLRNYIIRTLYATMMNSLHLDPPFYDEDIRIAILESSLEEEGTINFGTGKKQSHPNMLVKFGKALGMTKEEMHQAPIWGCTKAWLDELIGRCENSLIEALAGNNLTAELFNTIVFPRVLTGLKDKYNFSDDDLEFFYEHSDPEVEGEHVESGARLLAERIRTEEDAVKAEWTSRFTMYAIQDYYRRVHTHMTSMQAA